VPDLIADAGPLAGRRLTVDHELTIGRVQGDLVVDDPKLSRRHAVIRVTDSGLEVEDLGSTNGTFIDGKRLTAATPLMPGARLQLGDTILIAEAPPEPVSDATQLDVGPATQLDAGGATEIVRPAAPATSATPAAPVTAASPAMPVTSAAPAEPAATSLRPAASNPPPAGQPAAPAPAASARPTPPAPPASRGAAGRGAAAPPAAGGGAPADVGVFQPPPVLHGGLATRSWMPVAASYGSAAAALAGLVAYFALR
jgi:predicted component of type VI protein secretion system